MIDIKDLAKDAAEKRDRERAEAYARDQEQELARKRSRMAWALKTYLGIGADRSRHAHAHATDPAQHVIEESKSDPWLVTVDGLQFRYHERRLYDYDANEFYLVKPCDQEYDSPEGQKLKCEGEVRYQIQNGIAELHDILSGQKQPLPCTGCEERRQAAIERILTTPKAPSGVERLGQVLRDVIREEIAASQE
jgi:hypothetical protein